PRSRGRSSNEQPDADADEQAPEPGGELPHGDPLLHRRAGDHADDRRQPGDRGGAGLRLSVQRVRERAGDTRDENRGQRRGRRLTGREAADHDQRRNDDDPAADAEERAQEACDEPDRDEPGHATTLSAWTRWPVSLPSPSAPGSSSTSTARSRRSWRTRA